MRNNDPDLLYGVAAIAEHLEMTPGKVRHLIRSADLPTFSLGERNVSARKSSLRHWLAECEARAREARQTDTRAEIRASLDRLRSSLATAAPGSPAATAFAAAIRRRERELAQAEAGGR